MIDLSSCLVVSDNSGKIEPFSRDKLLISLNDSLRHRKSHVYDSSELTDTVINKVLHLISSATITRDELVGVITEILDNFDHAAAVQFAAFHPVK
jgi:transcriptional regulator NrdR family protein